MQSESGRTPSEAIWDPTILPDVLDGVEGYSVQAADGVLGTVTAASSERGRSYLIVATEGSWNRGRTVMLPPGVVTRIDRSAKVIHVRCARAQVGGAPSFENDRYQDAAYRSEVGGYYASLGGPPAGPATPGSVAPHGPASVSYQGYGASRARFLLLEQWFERAGAG